MKKFSVISRMLLIIRKLKRSGYMTPEELLDYIHREMSVRGEYDEISQRTLQRDFALIRETMGVEIACKKGVGYHIQEEYPDPHSYYDTLLNDFDILCALDADTGKDKYILSEHHRPVSNHYLPELIHAVRTSEAIDFDYTLLRYGGKVVHKHVQPYFLKESNQRWYVIGFEEGRLKAFGVERMQHLVVRKDCGFGRVPVDADSLFRDCYGIWSQPDMPVEYIELEYSALDGAFLKTLPIHHSQRVIYEDENTVRISLELKITNDLVMELLSRSNSLRVIKPESLKTRVRNIYAEALKRHS